MIFAGPAQPSPVSGASQGNARVESQVRALAASPQLGPDLAQWVDSGGFYETGVSLSSLPIAAAPPIPPGSSGSHGSCASDSLLGTAEGIEFPVERGKESLGGGGEGASRHLIAPCPQPLVLHHRCLWKAQIRDEKLIGQVFMKVTSSTLAFPRQPPPPHAPNPVVN